MSQDLPSVSEIQEEEYESERTNPRISFDSATAIGARLRRGPHSNLSNPSSSGAASTEDSSTPTSRGHFHVSSFTNFLPFYRGDSRREDSGELSSGSYGQGRPFMKKAVTSRLGKKASDNTDIESRGKSSEPRYYRRYRVGDPVLVSTDDVSRLALPVNRYGYPPGEGHSSDEQRGPYRYVYATVTKVHFGENAQYYTVTRADTGASQRADDEWMEPLKTARGEAAARRAATHFEDAHDNVENDSNLSHDPLYILVVPFLWLWRCIYHKCMEKCLRFTLRQAKLFLNGAPPYSFSADFTMVNFFVLCNIWMTFIDQARLAFFKPSADFALAIVDLFVFVVLVVELFCEVFVRPEGYQIMLFSEKAYAPSTAQFINRFHLIGETIALLTFAPEFICLFSGHDCSDRLNFSLFNALYMEVLGPTRTSAFYGRAFLALVRLRVFGLVRHWKKMWIHNTFITMTPTGMKHMVGQLKQHNLVMETEEKDKGLTNAANIGTALMVINSHRALIILWAIMGCLPLLTVIFVNGNANLIAINMVNQLQATNQIVTEVGDPNGCEYLTESMYAWTTGVVAGNHANLDKNEYTPYVLYLWLEPRRCPFRLADGNLTESDETATSVLCSIFTTNIDPNLLTEEEANIIKTVCSVWGDGRQNTTNEELAFKADIRIGAIQDVLFWNWGNLTLVDGTVNETIYSVAAKFNVTTSVGTAAFASFLLQVSLLICVLGGLTVLRRDAIVLVLGPLRRMLKIVARYAKNPLAHTTASHHSKVGNESDDESDIARASTSEDQLGNFETTQLINAITKIADLLRKCWGVAGADIISTNLATQEGALTEVFNPTVPGKSVYALFGFAAINEFSHMVHNLGGDVMILINDVANVLHGEVFRWGYGDSGQCNKNLGSAFLMVFRIGLVKEVIKKLEQATDVVFAGSAQKGGVRRRKKSRGGSKSASMADSRGGTTSRSTTTIKAMNLQSLPGISTFTDRAVIGMLKSYACIYRDEKLLAWRDDFRLGAGVGAFSVNMFFGLDAGWAVEGAVGSEYKIDATYLSPHVNMASRMMSACKQYGVSILLSQAVQELMSSTARSKLRHLDTVTVKGSSLKQRIYTYDARHKGVDFFLFSRSDEQADLDAERYSPRLWEVDMDLRAMRQHVTDDFLAEFNKGRDYYLYGEWKKAIKHLERADEIMVENVMDLGYIEEELNELRSRIIDGEVLAEEELRNETGDGPSRCLITFMKNAGGVAPKDWKGYRPLTSK